MPTQLSDLTTMRLGGPARHFEVAESTDQLVDLVRQADAAGEQLLVIGGGSNLVVGDAGFDGWVVQVASSGLEIDSDRLRVDAGRNWDEVVSTALDAGLAGLEPLSGIPGSTGGTPVQNVGAYGTVTSDVLTELTVFDRAENEIQRWTAAQCGFGPHRQSVFKHSRRFVVLDVTFTLSESTQSNPIRYAALADRLGVALGDTADTDAVRKAVLALRTERAMVLDDANHDTWSVGSFFLNPVVAEVPDAARECPQFPDPDGTKLSAGWLIDHAGFHRGYGRDFGEGRVALSSRHALAITNLGGATTAEVMRFAAHIRSGVQAAYDVRLSPECNLVNCSF